MRTISWPLVALVVACTGKAELKVNASNEGVDTQQNVAWSGDETLEETPEEATEPPEDRSDGRRVDRIEEGAQSRPVATLPGFRMLEGGGSRVFVEISGRAAVKQSARPGTLIYYLEGVRVPERVNRMSLPTRHFTTPVDRVRLVQIDNDAELIIELRVPVEGKTHLNNNSRGTVLSIDFDKIDQETLEKARLTYGRLRRDLPVTKPNDARKDTPGDTVEDETDDDESD